MAPSNQVSVAGLPDINSILLPLSIIGFVLQWGTMLVQGSLTQYIIVAWQGHFPSGTPVKNVWTGIFPLDLPLVILVAFFQSLLNLAEIPRLEGYLLLVDLLFALTVPGVLVIAEDRRNRKTGPLRYPAFWQMLWGFFGVASAVSTYTRLYIKHRLPNSPNIPSDQAQALPFTAVLQIFLVPVVVAPYILGATLTQVAYGTVAYFLSPLIAGPFQDLISNLMARIGPIFSNPVLLSYYIVGTFSTVVHWAVVLFTFQSPELDLFTLYVPNPSIVRRGSPTQISESGHHFIQYGYLFFNIAVLILGKYASTLDSRVAERAQANHPLLTVAAITLVGGPGAGMAWILSKREDTLATRAPVKDS
ncbi:hypothetical protein F4774DRAFT_66853 [Daldinia eschscholtzii]|nr:hypothetical protein F4774DRAFT_66853 [Daldinia eschscholtzii]